MSQNTSTKNPVLQPVVAPVTKSAASKIFYTTGTVLLGLWLLVQLINQNNKAGQQPPSTAQTSFTTLAIPESTSVPEATPAAIIADTPVQIRRAQPTEAARASEPTLLSPTPALGLQSPALAEGSHLPLYILPTPTIVPPIAPTLRVVGISARDTLNVRSAPGSEFPIVVRLRPGVRGITLQNDRVANGSTIWQRISVHGYEGWVNESYLAPDISKR